MDIYNLLVKKCSEEGTEEKRAVKIKRLRVL